MVSMPDDLEGPLAFLDQGVEDDASPDRRIGGEVGVAREYASGAFRARVGRGSWIRCVECP
jgi:hypothetical protein